jgi:(methylthio)acryloyl-CoA hydratase
MNRNYTEVRVDGQIAELAMIREDKRNAMSDGLLTEIETFYAGLPAEVRVVILYGKGGHFCSGLDLAEHVSRSAEEGVYHSRNWHRVLDMIQYGGKITVSAMTGAVIGGGLELATATHVRIAEPSVIFQLPEGRRGIFVGGGATVRVGRILGADRMTEMMLTGRKYDAKEGLGFGLAHYNVAEGEALTLARKLAARIAQNAPMSNYFMVNAIPSITDMSRADGLLTESLAAALVQTTPDAEEGLKAFLEKRTPVFR